MTISVKNLLVFATILFLAATHPAGAAIDRQTSVDAKIKADVQGSLDEHPELGPPSAITVQSVDHVIYLYGLVDTDRDRWIAESLAARTPGVSKVVNSIAERN